jgi:hypothetical protein
MRAGKKSSAFTSASTASMRLPTIRNGMERSQRIGHSIKMRNASGQQNTNKSAHKSNVMRSFILVPSTVDALAQYPAHRLGYQGINGRRVPSPSEWRRADRHPRHLHGGIGQRPVASLAAPTVKRKSGSLAQQQLHRNRQHHGYEDRSDESRPFANDQPGAKPRARPLSHSHQQADLEMYLSSGQENQ